MNDIMSGKIKLNRNTSYNTVNSNAGGNSSFHSLNPNGNSIGHLLIDSFIIVNFDE